MKHPISPTTQSARRIPLSPLPIPQSAIRNPHSKGPPVVIRETPCKTILNKSSLSDYSLNCYTGCAHACVYCYARFMQRFHPHAEPWGRFVDVKVNAVEALERQLRRATPGDVFLSSACDGWQPTEASRRLTRQCARLLLAHGFHLGILTKSALVLRDLDLLSHPNVTLGVTVTTLDERLRQLWEPRASTTADRFHILTEARRAGIRTSIMFGPLLPFLSDSQSSLEAMFERARDLDVDSIWVDALNPRPRVWPAVAALLRKHFPDLHSRYSRILFDKRVRADYLADLRTRIAAAAHKSSLTDRVQTCL